MKALQDLNENSTLQDFIEFFEAIPEEKWCTGSYIENIDDHTFKCCAEGHLGNREDIYTPRACRTLQDICGRVNLTNVNDGKNEAYQQPTPKQRVIAYLKDLATKQ